MKARVFLLIGLFGASLAVTSCGVKTGLETPPPMWGKARRDYFAEQDRLKAEEAARAAAASTAPSTVAPLPPPSAPIGANSPLSPMAPAERTPN
jgi:hypothetical protein